MTLDEAIQHCEEKAQCGTVCGMEHKQLADWLKELKTLREKSEKKCNILDNVQSDIVAENSEESKPRRATNRELAKWLAKGNGEKTEDAYNKQSHSYIVDNYLVNDKIKIRKWEDTEWHEPTVDYMGI